MNFKSLFTISCYSVFSSWTVFGIVWLVLYVKNYIAKRIKKIKTRKTDALSFTGLILQVIAFTVIASIRRDFSMAVSHPGILYYVLIVLAMLIAPFSVLIAIYAVLTLGKQWSFVARVIDDHELITAGPYRIIRHPIYFAFFGLFISTAFVITPPAALLIATILFSWGTIQRIHSEERLLVEQFSEKYLEYRKKVHMLIPFIF